MLMNKVNSDINKKSIVSEWVEAYSDDLYDWAVHKTSDSRIAEDIVQETFISAYTGFNAFRADSNPKTWLFAILKNKIIDYHRKNFREMTMTETAVAKEKGSDFLDNFFNENGEWKEEARPHSWGEGGNLLDNPSFIEILEFCIRELPRLWRSAVKLKYLENCPGGEICQDLDISPSNFWQILHRAKLQLRACLNNNWFEKEND